jgi:hypothetical protein
MLDAAVIIRDRGKTKSKSLHPATPQVTPVDGRLYLALLLAIKN